MEKSFFKISICCKTHTVNEDTSIPASIQVDFVDTSNLGYFSFYWVLTYLREMYLSQSLPEGYFALFSDLFKAHVLFFCFFFCLFVFFFYLLFWKSIFSLAFFQFHLHFSISQFVFIIFQSISVNSDFLCQVFSHYIIPHLCILFNAHHKNSY